MDKLTEEQARAAEEEMAAAGAVDIGKIAVEDVLIQTVVTLINLGAHKAGLIPPAPKEGEEEPEPPKPDYEQLRVAIEGARVLMPLVESKFSERMGEADFKEMFAPLKESLARLQMIYVQAVGGGGEKGESGSPAPAKDGTGPAQSSGRLWVPGQGK